MTNIPKYDTILCRIHSSGKNNDKLCYINKFDWFSSSSGTFVVYVKQKDGTVTQSRYDRSQLELI